MILSVLDSSKIVGGSLMGSCFSYADCAPSGYVPTNFVPELSSFLCANAGFSSSGLTARGENSITKLARTCLFIVVLSKNLMSD